MDYSTYLGLFDAILGAEEPVAPYDNPEYLKYTSLNRSRMGRWTKSLELTDQLKEALAEIKNPQRWIIISEPWCGDAAHSLPVLVKAAAENPAISYEIQLRDAEPYLIQSYLTNGGKSIPKLIVRDSGGSDLFTWGPRPRAAQALQNDLVASGVGMEAMILELQKWYNSNAGSDVQLELTELLLNSVKSHSI